MNAQKICGKLKAVFSQETQQQQTLYNQAVRSSTEGKVTRSAIATTTKSSKNCYIINFISIFLNEILGDIPLNLLSKNNFGWEKIYIILLCVYFFEFFEF